MPNLNAPSGFARVMYRSGASWNGQTRIYAIAAANTNSFSVGDLVSIDGVNFAAPNGIPYVTRITAGAGNSIRGAVSAVMLAPPTGYVGGPYINPNNLAQVSRPAGAQASIYYVAVVDDPDVIFEVQEDTSAGPGQAAAMSKNATPLVANPAAGSNLSGFQLNASTYATGATLQIKVLGVVQRFDNDAFQPFQKLLVAINNHDFSSGTAGI